MGFEKQHKGKKRPLRCFAFHQATAIAASLLFLLYLAGCVKTVPQEDSPSPGPEAPIASQVEQENTAEATTVAKVTVPSVAEPEQHAVEEEPPAPQPVKEVEEQAFHLKPMQELAPPEPMKTPLSPKILQDGTMETKMPQLVADLAAKSKMFHPAHSPIKEGESCVSAKCHIKMVKVKYVHAPVATGACLICHTNIKQKPPFGLVSTGVDLCWRCHKNQKLVVLQSKYLHKIVKDEGCIHCHEPHSSNTTKFLLRKDELTLCVDCHKKETQKLMKQIASARVVHKPVAEGRCAGCHSPHASNYKNHLREGPKDVPLCFSCHKKMKQQTKDSVYKHGPIKEGMCTACHEPHAGNVPKDLKYKFEKTFYNPFDLEVYSLCFKCHKESVVLNKRTEYLTNFRNGDRNLHFLHVNRQKGRTCLACHEVHMGSQRRHIRKLTPFGTWEIPINFTLTETGGRCSANCHIPKEYDRKNPVKLMIDEEEKKLEVVKKEEK
jgi:predicted CXXCH cytochrome family protein